jgi:hypothetical protein
VTYLIGVRDVDSDGIFEGSQWNTPRFRMVRRGALFSGLYVAGLRAARAMAAVPSAMSSEQLPAGLFSYSRSSAFRAGVLRHR